MGHDMKQYMRIPQHKIHDWLYYETGFEQMHPYREIVEWMDSLGYAYDKDWFCRNIYDGLSDSNKGYELEFPNEQVMALWLLRWGDGQTIHNWYGRGI
jgi:hypothetical protein